MYFIFNKIIVIAINILLISFTNIFYSNTSVKSIVPSIPTSNSIDTLHLKAESEGYQLDVRMLKSLSNFEKMPAIIFVVGSGEGSTMSSYREFLHFFFEKELLEEGFAIVAFDKRGLGKSEGLWYETGFEERAIDAKNVALKIGDFDFIDKDRIYIVGHSQGGWIVQIALAHFPEIFAGGISMAGPTFGVKRQIVNDYKSRLECEGFEESKALKKAKRKVNRDLFFVSLLGRKGNFKQLNVIKKFEPESYIRSIYQPLLLLFAENDPLVSPEWSMEELHRIFPDDIPANIDYYIAEGQEHSFKISPKCFRGSRKDLNNSETTKVVLVEWMKGQTMDK